MLKLIWWLIKLAIFFSIVFVLVGVVLALFSPLRSSFVTVTETGGSNRDAVYVVTRQYNRVNLCATGGVAIDWIKSHFRSVAGQHTLCAFVDSEGTRVHLGTLPVIGDLDFDLPAIGQGYVINFPFTGDRIEIASGTENVLRLVDLVEEGSYESFLRRETLKLPAVRTVEMPRHREFVILTPGTRITNILVDTTKGTAKDLDEIPLLVDFRLASNTEVGNDGSGSLQIHLGEEDEQ